MLMDENRWKERFDALQGIVIIPTYNNADTIEQVIADVKLYATHILVVNDGSTDGTVDILNLVKDIEVIGYENNRGKGKALQIGLDYAQNKKYRYAITIDSDGQHFALDIPTFITHIEQHPDTLLVGARNIQQENMPKQNTFANKFSNFWFKMETWVDLTDTQSGFRLYPLNKIKVRGFGYTSKYEYELEILVYASWRGVVVQNVPIQVYYAPKEERVSHFRPFQDFTRISILNSILVVIALFWIYPRDFFRKFTWTNIKAFFEKHLFKTQDSNSKIVKSVMLGIFCGVIPAWGYQMILALFLAQLFKLNKVIAVLTSNISIPPFLPFILYLSYVTGGLVLGKNTSISMKDISFDQIQNVLGQYVLGSFIFAVIASVGIGLITALILSIKRKQK